MGFSPALPRVLAHLQLLALPPVLARLALPEGATKDVIECIKLVSPSLLVVLAVRHFLVVQSHLALLAVLALLELLALLERLELPALPARRSLRRKQKHTERCSSDKYSLFHLDLQVQEAHVIS